MDEFVDKVNLITIERAINIIGSLRKGTPPRDDVDLFAIGREELVDYFREKFSEIAKYDTQGVKFISADYGHGKTHFLDMLAKIALEQNFIVSIVTLDRENAPFNKLEKVIPLIMKGITTPKSKEKVNSLEQILDEWAAKVKGLNYNEVLFYIDDQQELQVLPPDFRFKLADYAKAYNSPIGKSYEECLRIEKWFRGEETKSKTFKDIPEFLTSFIQLVKHLGYSGFVVMLDEAESITLLSKITNRDQANENLRQIIDNPEFRGFYFIFASTPSFLSGEDDRGAQTYPALWRRITDPLGRGINQRSLEKIIIELPELNESQLKTIALRIKKIYEIAYNKSLDIVTDFHFGKLSKYIVERTDNSVRTLVRSTVMLLDEASQNDELDANLIYEGIVENILQSEEYQRAK